MSRAEFSSAIKNSLALRAGYQCSICKKVTVGPSDETSSSITKTGIAAHIFSASQGSGSRRLDFTLPNEYLSLIENGIWLCNLHATTIDRDERTYTATHLQQIKKNHESLIAFSNGGLNGQMGVITKIEVANLPCLSSNIKLEFLDKNVIYGSNGVGKTMICEFIKALNDKKQLDRWHRKPKKVNVYFHIYFFKLQEEKYSFLISHDDKLQYLLNDTKVPFLDPPIRIFYLKENLSDYLRKVPNKDELTFIQIISGYFSISENEFKNTIEAMHRREKLFIDDIFISEDSEDLTVNMNNRTGSFESFSGGEKQRIILDIVFTIAEYYSKYSSTILIVESNAVGTIDTKGIEFLLDFIRFKNLSFQFIMTMFEKNSTYNFENYKVYELIKKDHSGVNSIEVA